MLGIALEAVSFNHDKDQATIVYDGSTLISYSIKNQRSKLNSHNSTLFYLKFGLWLALGPRFLLIKKPPSNFWVVFYK